MGRIVGLTVLMMFSGMAVAYGAANVWDFTGPFSASGVEGLPDPPERLEVWDFWEGEEAGKGGGGSGLLPLPSGRGDSVGDSRPRGISDPPERLEIWDFWGPGQYTGLWEFAGGGMR
jgi:hypothetical protein